MSEFLRSRVGRGSRAFLAGLAALAAAVGVAGCSVDGRATGQADLSEKSVTADAFPAGASRVPTPAMPGLIADVTGRPLSGSLEPSSCTPEAVSTAGAVAYAGPVAQGSMTTLTSLVVATDENLSALEQRLRGCPTYRSGVGTPATSDVTVEVSTIEAMGGGITVKRTIVTGGPTPISTTVTTEIAQRDGVRVYVESRGPTSEADSKVVGWERGVLFGRASF